MSSEHQSENQSDMPDAEPAESAEERAIRIALRAVQEREQGAWWREGLDEQRRAGAASPLDRARDQKRPG
jgi:hypothetical protein